MHCLDEPHMSGFYTRAYLHGEQEHSGSLEVLRESTMDCLAESCLLCYGVEMLWGCEHSIDVIVQSYIFAVWIEVSSSLHHCMMESVSRDIHSPNSCCWWLSRRNVKPQNMLIDCSLITIEKTYIKHQYMGTNAALWPKGYGVLGKTRKENDSLGWEFAWL